MDKWFEWAIIVISGLGVYIWKTQTKKHDDLTDRMHELEKTSVSKSDFSEFKDELNSNYKTIMKTLEGINDKVITRETADLIAENKCNEALLKHANNCPFAKSVMNNRNI